MLAFNARMIKRNPAELVWSSNGVRKLASRFACKKRHEKFKT
jgi:hypothetical protein